VRYFKVLRLSTLDRDVNPETNVVGVLRVLQNRVWRKIFGPKGKMQQEGG